MAAQHDAGLRDRATIFYDSLLLAAKLGLVVADDVRSIWGAYSRALSRGETYLLDAASVWSTLLDGVRSGRLPSSQAVEHVITYLDTGAIGVAPLVPTIIRPPAGSPIKGASIFRIPQDPLPRKRACPPPQIRVEHFDKDKKVYPGALIVKYATTKKDGVDNKAPLQKFELKWEIHLPPARPVLSISTDLLPRGADLRGDRVVIYRDDQKTVLELKNGRHVFGAGELVTWKTFYLRGVGPSYYPRDITMTLSVIDVPPGVECAEDVARFTCLWVEKPEIRDEGRTSPDSPTA